MRPEVTATSGPTGGDDGRAVLLTEAEKYEALSFLAERPLHTVYMAGLLRDNGVVSSLNRGRLYSYRGAHGDIEGIALLGHATLIEARTEASLTDFARLAQRSRVPYLIRGEEGFVEKFWRHYGKSGHANRLVCRELLLEQVSAPEGKETGLRQATLADLESIVTVNSEMARAESGSNPLARDPDGFRRRTALRISKGRHWIWMEDGKLLFKADVIADTPEVIYLEGIYVQPDERRKGYGSTCLSQLGRLLLRRTGSICLTLNAREQETEYFYRKAGYTLRSYYDTIYLKPARQTL